MSVVWYLAMGVNHNNQCVLIWLSISTAYRYLSHYIKCLLQYLHLMNDARVVMPANQAELETQAYMVAGFRRAMQHCVGFVDGTLLKTQASTDPVLQNAFYNG